MAFSNSKSQKEYIDGQAKERKLGNLQVITGNVADYEFEHESFDRVVSIEVSFLSYHDMETGLLTTTRCLNT